ncbi:M28 family peptidase [Cellulosilyticum sp. ST5]|uniref:M28 family peptidase n=1 Tax=Cellulosilyticum sp. ST5 TaxID=3055805 RepID=UPI0039775AA9
MRDQVEKYIDIHYAYEFAKKLETYKCNTKLGFRTAGSRAEILTGQLIYKEMQQIGLEHITKDEITVDSWEFQKAQLSFEDLDGQSYQFELGAYQTQFQTEGPQKFSMVYLEKGTAEDYKGVDVKGKLVLVDINQRDEWWINFPVYEAYLKGAAALIAVQASGYGEIDQTALNAQDIAGPSEAVAFSISQRDAYYLKEALKVRSEIEVTFDAISIVKPNQKTYNIVGKIQGTDPDAMILLSAHYDSYFEGFQDDNVAVAMILGIARAIKQSGYKPKRTLVFAAMAAEEWGLINSKYDWSTGAYEEVFHVHPGWKGKVIADLNFELPAHAHGKKDKVRCVYEYAEFIDAFIKEIKIPEEAYPEGIEVTYPIETWSDDFSIAIAGIPSMVNDFSSGSFMETHYHSQFDNKDFYNEAVYTFHHKFYTKLVMALDQTAVVPLNFMRLFEEMGRSLCSIDQSLMDIKVINILLNQLKGLSKQLYAYVQRVNKQYLTYLMQENTEKAAEIYRDYRWLEKQLLAGFAREQDELVRLNWHDEVYFPHEIIIKNLQCIKKAILALEEKEIIEALSSIYQIDNNKYAFLFEKQVYEYFTDYVLCQPIDRVKWGAGRIIGHEDLFDIVHSLKAKIKMGQPNVENEIRQLEEVCRRQQNLLDDILKDEKDFLEAFYSYMAEILGKLDRDKL